VNFFHRVTPHHFGPALGVRDVHLKKELHGGVKYAARKTALPRLHLVQHGPLYPARANDAIRLVNVPHQIQKGVRARGSVRIHITD